LLVNFPNEQSNGRQEGIQEEIKEEIKEEEDEQKFMLYNVQIISVNITKKNSLAEQAKERAAASVGKNKTPRLSSPPISQMQVTPQVVSQLYPIKQWKSDVKTATGQCLSK